MVSEKAKLLFRMAIRIVHVQPIETVLKCKEEQALENVKIYPNSQLFEMLYQNYLNGIEKDEKVRKMAKIFVDIKRVGNPGQAKVDY